MGGHRNFGGGGVKIGEHFQAHDFIELKPRNKTRITERCAPLYEKGLSIRDIEEATGIPKSTVREALKSSGKVLRNPLNCNASKIDRTETKRGGHTPYGFVSWMESF